MQQREQDRNLYSNMPYPEDIDARKTRRGKVGGYIDYMSIEDIEYCNLILLKHNYFERMNG